MFGSMNDIFTLVASDCVRLRAVLLQRPLVNDRILHGCSNYLGQNLLMTNTCIDGWPCPPPRFHKHDATPTNTPTDVGVLMLHYQVARDSPGGATSNSKMSKLAYYRHASCALMCPQKSFNLCRLYYSFASWQKSAFFGGGGVGPRSLRNKGSDPYSAWMKYVVCLHIYIP